MTSFITPNLPATVTPPVGFAYLRMTMAIAFFLIAIFFFGKPQATIPAPAHQAPAPLTAFDPN